MKNIYYNNLSIQSQALSILFKGGGGGGQLPVKTKYACASSPVW